MSASRLLIKKVVVRACVRAHVCVCMYVCVCMRVRVRVCCPVKST